MKKIIQALGQKWSKLTAMREAYQADKKSDNLPQITKASSERAQTLRIEISTATIVKVLLVFFVFGRWFFPVCFYLCSSVCHSYISLDLF